MTNCESLVPSMELFCSFLHKDFVPSHLLLYVFLATCKSMMKVFQVNERKTGLWVFSNFIVCLVLGIVLIFCFISVFSFSNISIIWDYFCFDCTLNNKIQYSKFNKIKIPNLFFKILFVNMSPVIKVGQFTLEGGVVTL